MTKRKIEPQLLPAISRLFEGWGIPDKRIWRILVLRALPVEYREAILVVIRTGIGDIGPKLWGVVSGFILLNPQSKESIVGRAKGLREEFLRFQNEPAKQQQLIELFNRAAQIAYDSSFFSPQEK